MCKSLENDLAVHKGHERDGGVDDWDQLSNGCLANSDFSFFLLVDSWTRIPCPNAALTSAELFIWTVAAISKSVFTQGEQGNLAFEVFAFEFW